MSNSNQPTDELSQLDHEILRTLVRRNEVIATLSMQEHLPSVSDENTRLGQLIAAQAGGEHQSEFGQVMRHIASLSRAMVQNHRISFLGPIYSYSHLAAIKYFGDAAQFDPVSSIPDVFEAVHRGDATSGLVPIENSTDGRIVDTLGMFVKQHMRICGEVLLPIHHNLLASGDAEQIREIHSKPQALSQCRGWLAAHFPKAELHEVSSTTAAAEAASKDTRVAAVASLPAGRAYGLTVLRANIEDNQDNVTRFAVLGTEDTRLTGNDKTSVLFQVEHQPGALANAMALFSDAGLNLTWIESFPAPGTHNEYLFFVELSGHQSEVAVAAAIERLAQISRRLDVLGSYPVAVLEA
ncbi:MAG: prephenate dehydratase [Planctomycetota bacterium]